MKPKKITWKPQPSYTGREAKYIDGIIKGSPLAMFSIGSKTGSIWLHVYLRGDIDGYTKDVKSVYEGKQLAKRVLSKYVRELGNNLKFYTE